MEPLFLWMDGWFDYFDPKFVKNMTEDFPTDFQKLIVTKLSQTGNIKLRALNVSSKDNLKMTMWRSYQHS
jgi:hypothetical protein